eukprot:13471431-Alexandrium_andersonii.AAC.1
MFAQCAPDLRTRARARAKTNALVLKQETHAEAASPLPESRAPKSSTLEAKQVCPTASATQ